MENNIDQVIKVALLFVIDRRMNGDAAEQEQADKDMKILHLCRKLVTCHALLYSNKIVTVTMLYNTVPAELRSRVACLLGTFQS